MLLRKFKKPIIALLLVLFAGYYAGITLFSHVHEVRGGRIVHSHPYSGTPCQPGHQHSTLQLQLIAHLSLLAFTLLFFCGSAPLLRKASRLEFALPVLHAEQQKPGTLCLRGPPSL